MQSIKIYLLLALIITFAAGIAGGVWLAPKAEPPKSRGEGGRGNPMSRIVDELKLSKEQREKVMAVFHKAMTEAPPPPFEEFRKCDKKRDAALDALLTDEQRRQASEINADFEREIEQLNAPGMAVFKKATAEARSLLTPAQQEQFDKLMQEKMPSFRGRWRGQPGAREGERGRDSSPQATQPRLSN